MEPIPFSLPHGPGFCFVSQIDAIDPGRHAQARYHLRGDEAFLAAHFPGRPLMPGVLMIEAIAQLGGILVQSDPAHPPLANLLLTAVQNAKILGSAVPGETLILQATMAGRMNGLAMVDGEVSCDGRRLLTARVTLAGSVE